MRIEIAVDCRCGVGEGPFWDEREGRLWWVDIQQRTVFAWSPGEPEPRRWTVPEFPSAVVLRERGGAVLAMRDGIYAFDPATGSTDLLVRHEPDRPDNRTNEAKCDRRGRFWIGTMQNNLHPDGSDKPMTGSFGALYRLDADLAVTRTVDGVGLSNTLAWTADERTMLFADTKTNVISAYTFDPDSGTPGERRVFSDEKLPGHCDGSTIDADGYLWNARFAGGQLIRFAPDGRVDRQIELPVTNPTSCCFGGPDLRKLYVTSARMGLSDPRPADGAILAIDAGVTGTPSIRFAG